MRRALVTGASRGVGRATALALGQRGLELFLLGRKSTEQEHTMTLLAQSNVPAQWVECDLSDRDQVDRALSECPNPFDVVVHNAAVIERSFVHETDDASWDRQLEVNLTAPFRITRKLLPAMLEAQKGRILFVSSISAVLGTRAQASYHASKAGLLGLMRCLAVELSDTGVSTMALLPGSIDTRMLSGSGFAPRMSPEEVAKTLVFHALDASAAHNGAVIEMFGT